MNAATERLLAAAVKLGQIQSPIDWMNASKYGVAMVALPIAVAEEWDLALAGFLRETQQSQEEGA